MVETRGMKLRSQSCPESIEPERDPDHDTSFDSLPSDMLQAIAASLTSPRDLISFTQTSRGPKKLVKSADAVLWGRLCKLKWSHHSLIDEAASIAGSYRAYAMEKNRSSINPGPEGWFTACESELLASIRRIGSSLSTDEEGDEGGGDPGSGSLVFLIDGSGSVSTEEFQASLRFILQATREVKRMRADRVKVTVVQFSNGAKIEYPIFTLDEEGVPRESDQDFERVVNSIVRIGGGTQLDEAITATGRIFVKQNHGPSSSSARGKTVVLICDGRIDSAQSREAKQMAQQLADEQGGVSMFAFGVGRGVEKDQLQEIISPCCPHTKAGERYKLKEKDERYFDLFFKLDGPW